MGSHGQAMEGSKASELEAELEKELDGLRRDPNSYAAYLRARESQYKGKQIELLKDDLKTKVLLETKDGRKACLAAISALDKAKGLKQYEFKRGLHNVAVAH